MHIRLITMHHIISWYKNPVPAAKNVLYHSSTDTVLLFIPLQPMIVHCLIREHSMPSIPLPPFNTEAIRSFVDSAGKLLPSEKSREDLQQNLHLLLQSAISRMDLVTREEFDAQTAVLHKLQRRVETLEQAMKALENPSDKT